jgi:hypothetical protein
MQCARHPKVETALSCGRCETPVCPKCLVHAEVGIRCLKCSPRRRLITQRNFGIGGGGLVAGVIGLAVVASLLGGRNSGPGDFAIPDEFQARTVPLAGVSAGAGPARLAVVTSACLQVEFAGVAQCEGTVRNVSGVKLEGVQVIVQWLTGEGEVAAADSAPVQFDPLLPDQTSPWILVAGSYNPEFKEYRLSFEDASGPVAAEGP